MNDNRGYPSAAEVQRLEREAIALRDTYVSGLVRRAGAAVARAARGLFEASQRRQERIALDALDRHMLQDIGLERAGRGVYRDTRTANENRPRSVA